MSLTSYLTDPNHQVLRDKFKESFPRPAFAFQRPLLAPALTQNYGIIGTAFDYLLRFVIQSRNKEKVVEADKWVADIAFPRLLKKFVNQEGKQAEIIHRYNRAKDNYQKFIAKGKISNSLFADTLFLAKLDLYFRIGYIAPDLLSENDLDIKDLKGLYSAVNKKDFLVKDQCFINPTFGNGSLIVGGADADIILDETIIDVKVTKHLKLERDYLNQTIGYAILAIIGGINANTNSFPVKSIGIYFARHGFLWKISLSEICSPDKLSEFKEWFITYFEGIRNEQRVDLSKQILIIKRKIKTTQKGKSLPKMLSENAQKKGLR